VVCHSDSGTDSSCNASLHSINRADYPRLLGNEQCRSENVHREFDRLLHVTAGRLASLVRFPDENIQPVLRVDHQGKLLYANKASQSLLDDWQIPTGEAIAQIPEGTDHLRAGWRNEPSTGVLPGCPVVIHASGAVDRPAESAAINDVAGHEAGNHMLREVGQRLQQLLAPGMTLARVGGDVFGVLVPEHTG
jgi:hypothetical protein